ncbi:MAG: DUF1467 family protein [Alphaproteobacteria bacterium]|nr:DUF1467 family protein [Alphaproteobacteria bacterium]
MSYVSGILVYIVLWWLVFFAVLPWGIQPASQRQVGWQNGVPEKHMLWLKAAVTTAISLLIMLIFYLFIPADMMAWAIFKIQS